MKIIKKWKLERGYTFQHICDLMGVSISHAQSVFHGTCGASEDVRKRVEKIERLLQIMDGEPADLVLLKYELADMIGISMEELEKRERKAYARTSSEARESLEKQFHKLKMFTLKSLLRIAENGYMSLSRDGVFFDKELVDNEIERKLLKKEQKQELNKPFVFDPYTGERLSVPQDAP